MALATLQNIRDKTRRLTRSPAEAQLSTTQLDDYINTFLLYDFPSELRLFSLRTTLNFFTQPGVDVYETNNIVGDPLYNFKNRYITIHPQVFMAGVPASFTQYRDVFYGLWPQTNAIVDTGLLGDGTTGPFAGVVPAINNVPTFPLSNSPHLLQRSVVFTALDANGTAMVLTDNPVSNTTGAMGLPGVPQTLPSPYGQVNYLTGAYSITFPNATMVSTAANPSNPIYVEYIPYVAGKPISMLFYDEKFTIRPVPDRAYQIQLEADIRPTELLLTTQVPEIEQWWQFIAIGTAKLIFQDRVDVESLAMLAPMYREQFNFVQRTTLIQTANMRTQTIYTQGRSTAWGYNGYWPL